MSDCPETDGAAPIATGNELTTRQMVALLRAHMVEHGITQAQLARAIGRTEKHVSQVFTGKAGTGELDYWAFVLGLRFTVTLEARP